MKNHHHPNRALSQKEMEARRLRAVPYLKRNWSERNIGKKLGVSSIAIHQWKVVWRKKGVNGLKAGHYGRLSPLGGQKEKVVRKKILQGATVHGFSGDFWTLIPSPTNYWTHCHTCSILKIWQHYFLSSRMTA